MNSLPLPATGLDRLRENGRVMALVPVEPQPVLVDGRWIWNKTGEWIVQDRVPKVGAVWGAGMWNPGQTGAAGLTQLCPYHPGQRVWVPEPSTLCRYESNPPRLLVRYGNGACKTIETEQAHDLFHRYNFGAVPAADAPEEAARTFATVADVKPSVQVGKLTLDEIEQCGVYMDILPACGDHPDLECWVTGPPPAHAHVTSREALAEMYPNLAPAAWVWRVQLTAAPAAQPKE